MSLSEKRIYVFRYMRCSLCGASYAVQSTLSDLKSSSPLLAQTSHPPTRNLFGKTNDARGGGATDDAIDAGILNTDDHLHESRMKLSTAKILGNVR